jgi:hypothetical protein
MLCCGSARRALPTGSATQGRWILIHCGVPFLSIEFHADKVFDSVTLSPIPRKASIRQCPMIRFSKSFFDHR